METNWVVVVVGGAVAGSEAVYQLREKGIQVICIEQNILPYGKIEDGLPRWHVEQRQKEDEKINEKLNHPLVHLIPQTKLGRDLSFDEIYKSWGVSAILFANGAWRDRSLPVKGADDFVDKGLVYQNPLVYWFNHYHEPSYSGMRYDIPDNTVVIGGGLASMDVMKICQLEITLKALKKRGIDIDMLTLEKEGIPKFLSRHNLSWKDLNLKGTTLYYRRRVEDMPLAEVPENATPEQLAKFGALRKKILSNYSTKYIFETYTQHLPVSLIVDNGRLVGLNVVRTEVIDGVARPVEGSQREVRSELFISSIGSIPEPIPGLPWKGDRYDVKDLDGGELNGLSGVFIMGNAVTGKGNIRVSLVHARDVTKRVISTWLADTAKKMSTEKMNKTLARVKELQGKSGYDGNYSDWVAKQLALRQLSNSTK